MILRYLLAFAVSAIVTIGVAFALSQLINDDFEMLLMPGATSSNDIVETTPIIREPVDTFDDYVPTNPEAEFKIGIYYKNIEHYNINLIPNIIFYENGQFDFIDNELEFMYHNTGVYQISDDGKTIVCYVEIAESSVPDALVYKVDDDGILMLMNDPSAETGEIVTYIKDLV